jgi:hypothetical protein
MRVIDNISKNNKTFLNILYEFKIKLIDYIEIFNVIVDTYVISHNK